MKISPSQITRNLSLLVYGAVATVGAFAGGPWASIAIGYAVILFLAAVLSDRRVPYPAKDIMVLVATALAVMVLSNMNSTYPQTSWQTWLRLAGVFLPLMLLTSPVVQNRAAHPQLFNVLSVAAMAGALALGNELYCGGHMLKYVHGAKASLQEYNRGICYLVIFSFPVLAFLVLRARSPIAGKREWIAVILFLIYLLFPASLTESRSAKLALIVGLAVVMGTTYLPCITRGFLSALPVIFLGWPFAAQWFFHTHYELLAHFPDSWRARMEIWDYMSYRIMEKPLLGWGLGTSGKMDFHNPDGAQYVFTKVAASHSHNAFTQLWVEMGVPGLLLGLAFAYFTLNKAANVDKRLMPFALGAWAASLCLCMVAFSFWTDSLFAAFALTSLAFALLQKRLPVTAKQA